MSDRHPLRWIALLTGFLSLYAVPVFVGAY